MRFPYNEKGCAHCDSNQDCPTKLKRSRESMTKKFRTFKDENGRIWKSKCKDFFRLTAQEVRL